MYPKLISIGGFFLPTYGVLVALGFLAGLWITIRLAKRRGLPADDIANLAVYCALVGLAGSKILLVLMNLDEYLAEPSRLFSRDTLLSAGVYYGGFLAALGFGYLYIRKKHLPILGTMDVMAPGVALGHAIGRLGCFAAGCCWGVACDRPWAVTFRNPDAHALVGVPLGIPIHPTQIYESLLTFIVFLALLRRATHPYKPGSQLGLYLVLYSLARFGVEFFRFHEQPPLLFGLSVTQCIAVGLLAVGVWLLLRRPETPAMGVS
ncbi:MAG: prolipoprotein diacylglyceryl transferase [Bryobacterales bacterium]|nr:prolipoprotein diacylglyceryl transferase [Bryobacterales bacterium]